MNSPPLVRAISEVPPARNRIGLVESLAILKAKASSSFTPVYNVGASYAIDKHWGLTATLTYMPLKTYSSLVIKAADGSTLATTRTRLKADPLITFVGISYKF